MKTETGTQVDETIETLLNLAGESFHLDSGYWVKYEVKKVRITPQIPHGIRYSLTLHDRNSTRILGYDNAHRIKQQGKNKFRGRRIIWDHKHKNQKIFPYEFESAGQLIENFWKEVLEFTEI